MSQRCLVPRFFPLLALFALLALGGAAVADDDDEKERDHHRQDQLREAVEGGQIKPLSDVLRLVKPKLPGEVVGVEAEQEAGGWTYELRILDAQGRLFDVEVDAATATITGIEEK